ncbi:MAG: GH92 family glycosyl hydrolase [Bacteroidaceae bacterium]
MWSSKKRHQINLKGLVCGLICVSSSIVNASAISADKIDSTSPSTVNASQEKRDVLKWINPFIGTTNFGATNPGAVCPNGLMSVAPFNVMGSDTNKYDKDARWWSTPYEYENSFFTGLAHVNLSGVGCPDMGSLLLMPTAGALNVDYHDYGSAYHDEKASPGYYSLFLDKYGIKVETTATKRTACTRFTFPEGKGNILLNLGEGLTNESGSYMRQVNDHEVEGMKLLGTFCYSAQSVFPIYFVMRVDKDNLTPTYWKKQPKMTGVEAAWDASNGKNKLYNAYTKDIAGDRIGIAYSFDTTKEEQVTVRMGVSFVSMANARENLDAEQYTAKGTDKCASKCAASSFDEILQDAENAWRKDLGRIQVKGGTDDQKTVFYTALYHCLIHPNILQDVNGEYPMMESSQIGTTEGNRYTVFSLWDTYRNLHQLLTLVYPERQMQMVQTMVNMSKEHGWLPKWELFGRETLTMEGDPSIPVIVDSWMKGLRDFDVDAAYKTMYRSATAPGKENLMRPDNDDYLKLGYVPLHEEFDNSVSHALEYYIADYALSQFADSLGKKKDAKQFYEQSLRYKKYYSKEYGTLRPLLPNGEFVTPFDPQQGENFEPSPGFHEGTAWNYTFYVPHDIKGLARLMGGKRHFVDRLQQVFDEGLYDPANEPDIAYPYLFSNYPDEAWRTQKLVKELLAKNFTTKPDGIPGNDDAGAMSAWAVFSMMGFYPDLPGVARYTLTEPTFDEIIIKLDPKWMEGQDSLVIRKVDKVQRLKSYQISHKTLIHEGILSIPKAPKK